eukprot:905121_1
METQVSVVSEGQSQWREALDPASGNPYWWHIESKETTWDNPNNQEELKPMEDELRTDNTSNTITPQRSNAQGGDSSPITTNQAGVAISQSANQAPQPNQALLSPPPAAVMPAGEWTAPQNAMISAPPTVSPTGVQAAPVPQPAVQPSGSLGGIPATGLAGFTSTTWHVGCSTTTQLDGFITTTRCNGFSTTTRLNGFITTTR